MPPHSLGARAPRRPRGHHSLVFAALSAALTLAAPALVHAHPDGSFPRVYNLDWNNTINAYYLSRYDMVSLSTRVTNVQLDSLRALNPSIRRLVSTSYYMWFFAGPSGYPYQWGPYNASDPVYGWDRKFWDLMQNNGWWMSAVDSSGVRYHASMAFNMWMGNFSSHCPKNAQGKRLCDVYADFLCDNLLAGKHFDGIFFDYCSRGIAWMDWHMYGNCDYNQNCLDPNVAHTPDTKFATAFDCDNDGHAESTDSVDVWWRAGMDIIHNRLRQRLGASAIIVGNGNQQYTQLNGAMLENFPFLLGAGDPPPNPYGYKWNSNMFSTGFGYLGANSLIFAQPQYNMILTYTSDPANTIFEPNRTANRERFKRFTLASACMGDGYYCVNGIGNFWYWWEPEYDLQLGFPTGPCQQVIPAQGYLCYVRYFTNGEVWINPTSYPLDHIGARPAIAPWDATFVQYAPLDAGGPSASMARFDTPSPNPMRGMSTLRFALPLSRPATLQIFDVRGRLVKDVWNGVGTGAAQTAQWDGGTELGFAAPAGIYFARLSSPGQNIERRIVRME